MTVVCWADFCSVGLSPSFLRVIVRTSRRCLTPAFFDAFAAELGRPLALATLRADAPADDVLAAAFASAGLALRNARPGDGAGPAAPRCGTAGGGAAASLDLDAGDEGSRFASGSSDVDAILTVMADVAGAKLELDGAGDAVDGRDTVAAAGRAAGDCLAAALGDRTGCVGWGNGAAGAASAAINLRPERPGLYWDARFADEYLEGGLATEHVERMFRCLCDGAYVSLHVWSTGSGAGDDALAADVGRAVGAALRGATECVGPDS